MDGWPDLVAISFFSGFTQAAYALAAQYRALGVRVVAGGPHVTYWPEEALKHVDAVVTGEAESVWPELLRDAECGRLRKLYRGSPSDMTGLPMPRYDLLEKRFIVPRVIQATRGCPFRCSFCSVPDLNPGYRMRPVEDVIRDIASSHFPHFWQDKVAWFWDDNLLIQRRWAKDLLREMAGLNRWWLTQASIDIVKDRELLDLMERSGCIGIFLGIESLDSAALKSVGKHQNRAHEYKDAIDRLHDRGICVMAGLISGFDDQTPETIISTAGRLNALGVDVPFLSILTPFRGTQIYEEYLASGRILRDRGWRHYNGYNVAFQPAQMTQDELLAAHRRLWRRAFAPGAILERLARGTRQLSRGGMMLSAAMNGFYGLKCLTGNEPVAFRVGSGEAIQHPEAAMPQLSAIS